MNLYCFAYMHCIVFAYSPSPRWQVAGKPFSGKEKLQATQVLRLMTNLITRLWPTSNCGRQTWFQGTPFNNDDLLDVKVDGLLDV